MSTTLTVEGNTFDLSDMTARGVAADALDDAGRPDEANLLRWSTGVHEDGEACAALPIRVDGDTVVRWEPPSHLTVVDQDRGEHSGTGLRMTELVNVTTAYGDHTQERWADLDDDGREWWETTLADLHAAEVALAEAPADVRQEFNERWNYDGDLEYCAAAMRTCLENVTLDMRAVAE